MVIKKNKDNSFDIKGITKGKLMAIARALDELNTNDNLSTLQTEVKYFIDEALKES